MRADNSAHLIAAARKRSQATRDKAVRALRRLDATGRPITIETVAREAGVSRSWLYGQTDLRAEIERLHTSTASSPVQVPVRQRASDASLRSRLQAAQERVRALAAENRELREQLTAALGELRAQR
ncbi:DUF6262 family protein [Nonomuraea candida]|uniref:DUF6262 family protein n=1 Tax=Nonomuraea candida TaxID=359159 RepID=UPI0005BDEEEF|nr:DUF6262 family protein [Nonomuraea candida]